MLIFGISNLEIWWSGSDYSTAIHLQQTDPVLALLRRLTHPYMITTPQHKLLEGCNERENGSTILIPPGHSARTPETLPSKISTLLSSSSSQDGESVRIYLVYGDFAADQRFPRI